MMMRRFGLLAWMGVVMALGGCEGAGREVGTGIGATFTNTFAGLTGQKATPRQIEELRRLSYPDDAPVAGDLDILVRRRGGHIELLNRLPREFDRMELWLNRQYVSRVGTIAVGGDNEYSLHAFVNYHGEKYPVGGLLSPDRGFPVVLAELYDPQTQRRYRLAVIADL